MTEPVHLYTASEIANELGVKRNWVHNQSYKNPKAPKPDFTAQISGRSPTPLWAAESVNHWRAFAIGSNSLPRDVHRWQYCDHRATNQSNKRTVTWKLWWRCLPDGGTQWWFSTPDGWWTSENDGESWDATRLEMRPADYRYYCVNDYDKVRLQPAISAVLKRALELRRWLEEEQKCG